MAWVYTVISLFVVLYLLSLRKKKKTPPGPIALPILGHFHLLSQHPHKSLYNLAQKHGPIMGLRFGFIPTVVISSPAGAELVLKTHDQVLSGRPCLEANKYIAYDRGMIFSQNRSYWRQMRKLFTVKLLSSQKIEEFQAMRKSELGLFIEKIKQAADSRESVDISVGLLGLSVDMNCLMIFGRKFADKDLDEKGSFKAVFHEATELGATFNLADFFPYIGKFDLQGLNRRMKNVSKVFDGFLEKIIDDHVRDRDRGVDATEDFVDMMLSIMESGEEYDLKIDRRHIKAVLVELLMAGADTSSTTVEWGMSELLRHPHVMKKLKDELESVVGRNNIVEESHLEKLKYLDCVVKETMRLHPAAPLLIPHESMEDCVIDGFQIQKKTRIIVNVWAIGRDPTFWHEPNKFSPDRFIGSNIDSVGHDFQLLPFGSGRRGCPGRPLGLLAVQLLLAQLVHCFHWKLPKGMEPNDLDMTEHFGVVTSRKNALVAIPTYSLGY